GKRLDWSKLGLGSLEHVARRVGIRKVGFYRQIPTTKAGDGLGEGCLAIIVAAPGHTVVVAREVHARHIPAILGQTHDHGAGDTPEPADSGHQRNPGRHLLTLPHPADQRSILAALGRDDAPICARSSVLWDGVLYC